ncbi:hypothetical protein NP493_5251g00000, partial [Ridgeia piscesae]
PLSRVVALTDFPCEAVSSCGQPGDKLWTAADDGMGKVDIDFSRSPARPRSSDTYLICARLYNFEAYRRSLIAAIRFARVTSLRFADKVSVGLSICARCRVRRRGLGGTLLSDGCLSGGRYDRRSQPTFGRNFKDVLLALSVKITSRIRIVQNVPDLSVFADEIWRSAAFINQRRSHRARVVGGRGVDGRGEEGWAMGRLGMGKGRRETVGEWGTHRTCTCCESSCCRRCCTCDCQRTQTTRRGTRRQGRHRYLQSRVFQVMRSHDPGAASKRRWNVWPCTTTTPLLRSLVHR